MEANRLSYATKYAVGVHVPGRAAELVTCEYAWQAQDVVDREKGRRANLVDGASITKTRHGQQMQRWVFDGEDVVWRSVYTRNERRLAPGKAAKGDKVQFVYRGQVVTGTVVRVKKDGVRTVKLDDNDYFEEEMVDVKPSAARKYVLVDYDFDRSKSKYIEAATEPLSLQEFIDANAHDAEVMDEMPKIQALAVGDEVRFGGGAAPLTAVRRIS